jgi:hypothetical protein
MNLTNISNLKQSISDKAVQVFTELEIELEIIRRTLVKEGFFNIFKVLVIPYESPYESGSYHIKITENKVLLGQEAYEQSIIDKKESLLRWISSDISKQDWSGLKSTLRETHILKAINIDEGVSKALQIIEEELSKAW